MVWIKSNECTWLMTKNQEIWTYEWMVDFGQLVDQKFNSWPKSTVDLKPGFSCLYGLLLRMVNMNLYLVQIPRSMNECIDGPTRMTYKWFKSLDGSKTNQRPKRSMYWCKHESKNQWPMINAIWTRDMILKEPEGCVGLVDRI